MKEEPVNFLVQLKKTHRPGYQHDRQALLTSEVCEHEFGRQAGVGLPRERLRLLRLRDGDAGPFIREVGGRRRRNDFKVRHQRWSRR